MSEISKKIIINAPIEKVFKIISDFKSYPEFLNETKKVIIEKKTKTKVVATFTLQLMASIQYTLELSLKSPESVSWKFVKGQMMKDNKGSWQLKAVNKSKTEALYSIDVSFGAFVPKTISNMLVENNLPEMLKSFKKRAELSF